MWRWEVSMALILVFGLFVAFVSGIFAVLAFQHSEANGRMHQHARSYQAAWDVADKYQAKCVHLELTLKNEREENETRWAGLARAYDVEVHKNHTVESQRVQAWKALHQAIHELHANPDPKCVSCGDSIKVDDQCFTCGLYDIAEPHPLQPIAQA
jgi:hypothetical protein